MNKKEQIIKKEVVIDDTEDLEIKDVAYNKNSNQNILLYVLIFLFCVMLFSAIIFINNFYRSKDNDNKLIETIEVNTDKNQVLITNYGDIAEVITDESFQTKEKLKFERINSIELVTNKSAQQEGVIKFNVVLDILKNEFNRNDYANNDSDVLVRFSYSYDNKNWTYINNVISTNDSTLSPLMGNYYDISGLISPLKIVTNYELTAEPGNKTKMYWRSEVYIKNQEELKISKEFAANFKIEYKDND